MSATATLRPAGEVPQVLRQRLAAMAALTLGALSLALAIAVAIGNFPQGLTVAVTLFAAAAAAWYGLQRRGGRSRIALGLALVLVAGAVVLMLAEGQLVADAIIVAGICAAFACAKVAFAVRAELPAAAPASHPVLFFNPKSGGGKAERFHLAEEARVRSIEAIELKREDDLETLVRDAVARGADALAMAGGDGSQAIVAMVAAELGLPYACIPAGTRNHLALDLGVDRDDVAGALDSLVAGRERLVDLGEVNGRVFVNNVSLGLYGEAVQREGDREAKIRTLLQTLPDVVGPEGEPPY